MNNALNSGGAIFIENSGNISIYNNLFYKNTAKNGGCIYYYENGINFFNLLSKILKLLEVPWELDLKNNNFMKNEGFESGGCIKLALNFKSQLINGNDFIDNESPYGNNISSYAHRILIETGRFFYITIKVNILRK